MNRFLITCASAALLAAPALAQEGMGDVTAGEKDFNQCQTCHIVQNDAGETLAGRTARSGPNLFGVTGRTAGTADFRYGKDLIKAGEQGLVWTEENFVAYVQDPTGFLREFLDDKRARGKMAFRVRSEEEAHNLYAFLNSFAPADEDETAKTN